MDNPTSAGDAKYLEELLREEYWNNHGCELAARYGDDGEMQCGNCATDFLRMPIEKLHQFVVMRRLKRGAELLRPATSAGEEVR